MLQIPGQKVNQIFPHSREYEQGLGRIRKGAHNFVVAQDGSGDFSDINEAIRNLPSGGGGIFIKEGSYDLQKTITIGKNNVTLIGTGKATIIKCTGNFSVADLITASSKSGITIRDIYFDSTNAYGVVGGINFNATTNSFIGYCWFAGTSGFNVQLMNGSSGNIFIQNRIVSAYGILIDHSNSNTIQGNICTSGQTGIYLNDNASNNIILGNVSSSNAIGCGIEIVASTGHTCDRNIAAENICQSNGVYGIYVHKTGTGTCTSNLIHGNVCNSNASGQIQDSGTSTTVADNITA